MYRPMIGSRNKILGSGDSCYHAYLVPWVLLFGLFSLWRPATSVKMNGYLEKLNWILVWIFSIDWYLNWPHWTYDVIWPNSRKNITIEKRKKLGERMASIWYTNWGRVLNLFKADKKEAAHQGLGRKGWKS